MSGETYHGKQRTSSRQFAFDDLFQFLIPAYPIDASEMRPVTKISVFGVRLAIVVLAAYWLVIFIGTHLPATVEIAGHTNDKVKHFSAFFVLGGLLCYVTNSPHWFLRFTTIGLAGMAYAAIDEWTQNFVPGRVPDVMDFAADSAGLWCAIAIYLVGKCIDHYWTTRPQAHET